MELMDAIRNRRAVREFADVALSRSTIQALIEAANLAPSAMNLQPWAFAVLSDRKRIDDCSERIKGWLQENWPKMGIGDAAQHLLDQPGFTVLYHAPALVVVLATSPTAQANEDCCLAAENLMLAARDREIGSCWIGFARPWLDLPETKKELGIPEHFRAVAPIVLGIPKTWPESHGRKKPQIHWVGT